MPSTILRIDTSMRRTGSTTRKLTDQLIENLAPSSVIHRDLADGVEFIDESWIGANFTDPADRTEDQKATLAVSDALVAEIQAADTLVIGVPVYNFGIPGALKAWVDLVARARLTFRYTETGPVGLMEGKTAWLVVASGGVPVGSPVDFATTYMRHVLGFIGITDVRIIDGSGQNANADAAASRAADDLAKAA